MVKAILRFVACCRTAGYRVSTSEVLDCISQLELVDMLGGKLTMVHTLDQAE